MTAPVAVRNGMYVKVNDLSSESLAYLNAEGERWGIAPSRLASLILKVVCDDRMINAVLDEDKLSALIQSKTRRKRMYRGRRLPDL